MRSYPSATAVQARKLALQVKRALTPAEESLVRFGAVKLHLFHRLGPMGMTAVLLEPGNKTVVRRVLVDLPWVNDDVASRVADALHELRCSWGQ